MAALRAGYLTRMRCEHASLRAQIGDALASNSVAGHVNSSVVLGRLWALDPDTLMRGMCMLYERDAASINRILDVAQANLPWAPMKRSCIEIGQS